MNRAGARIARIPWSARPRRCSAAAARGFTLVELMFTIAIAAILIAIAVPSFQHVIASSRLTTTANSMIGALQTARMEAIKRNGDVRFCGDSSAACAPGEVYAPGTATASTVQIIAAPAIPAASTHLQTVTTLQFDAHGLAHKVGESAPYGATVVKLCSSSISSDNVRTITMITGSVLHTKKSSGDCP